MLPLQPPITFEQMTKYLSVSKGLPGPIIAFHQPGSDSSLSEARGMGVPGKGVQDEDRVGLLGVELPVGFVGERHRPQGLPAFELQRVGPSAKVNCCVSTTPSEPLIQLQAAFPMVSFSLLLSYTPCAFLSRLRRQFLEQPRWTGTALPYRGERRRSACRRFPAVWRPPGPPRGRRRRRCRPGSPPRGRDAGR